MKGDPYMLKLRYSGTCKKCKTALGRGVNAYYWPSTREVFCLSCGHKDYQQFLSDAADEDVYNGSGNPYYQ
jgi:RNase P subunit RPR2